MDQVSDTELKRGAISATIDPLLFEGGHSISEVASLVGQKFGAAVEGKNLSNYVSVRISTLTKRGFVVSKSADGKVKLSK